MTLIDLAAASLIYQPLRSNLIASGHATSAYTSRKVTAYLMISELGGHQCSF
jgi:hypothetical protein